ncbi:MAG TPA: SDR family oxidoreductase [Solirubrobacteraceae bacterium]|nr:SDR family oxidoreductase [Solirubrobacteraceae bacterium]
MSASSPKASMAATRPRFAGKVIAVTGATAGIGTVTARRLAEEAGTLVLTGRNRAGAEALLDELADERTTFVAGDIRDPATAERVVTAALERYGALDVLVNNAAVDHTGDVLETPIEEVRELFEVNVFGAIQMLQAAGRAMRGRGGAIVNVSSRLALIGVPTMAMYSAAKGALLSLTRAAAVELARDGIRVNAVAPGMTRTPLFEAWAAAEGSDVVDRAAAAIPQGRFATPEEVAAAIAFLASDEAGHITGASLPVDGGYTAA